MASAPPSSVPVRLDWSTGHGGRDRGQEQGAIQWPGFILGFCIADAAETLQHVHRFTVR